VDDRTVAWDVMGTLFEIAPVSERYGAGTMPRLLHLALSLQAAGRFVPFPELVERQLGEEALEVFASLEPVEDAEPALQVLADAGLRQVTLTNGSVENTRTLIERAGLQRFFADVLSVEQVQVYKPAPEPYGLVDAASTVLLAAHDWDCAGAGAAGLRAIYVDRQDEGWTLPVPEPERVRDLVAAARLAAV
jgi:2-haloacid dehalogenase